LSNFADRRTNYAKQKHTISLATVITRLATATRVLVTLYGFET